MVKLNGNSVNGGWKTKEKLKQLRKKRKVFKKSKKEIEKKNERRI